MRELRSLSALAARQHGVFRGAPASSSAIDRAVKSGLLERHYRGVYSFGPLSRDGALLAAVFAAGDGAALGSLNAAVLDPRDITICIPITTVARTLVDQTDERTPEQLASLIHQAEYNKRLSLEATRAAVARSKNRNLHVLERALQLRAAGSAGTRSGLEDRSSSSSAAPACPSRSSTPTTSASRSTGRPVTAAHPGRRSHPGRRPAGPGLQDPALPRAGPRRPRGGATPARGVGACRRRCGGGRRRSRSPWAP